MKESKKERKNNGRKKDICDSRSEQGKRGKKAKTTALWNAGLQTEKNKIHTWTYGDRQGRGTGKEG
ncbi:hypothetical protein K457DRAFT_143132 [Linnemannia elongata AG-77]|uniref:Uncharacterized protein n=1 Tax=Linnemannia elongata AG-77 TaxID=1314771 RepID=A0A197JEP1_9FUNG|nr:hypothetical protein K457DRAFT_143132 [Linnemannia elongata AG-77]